MPGPACPSHRRLANRALALASALSAPRPIFGDRDHPTRVFRAQAPSMPVQAGPGNVPCFLQKRQRSEKCACPNREGRACGAEQTRRMGVRIQLNANRSRGDRTRAALAARSGGRRAPAVLPAVYKRARGSVSQLITLTRALASSFVWIARTGVLEAKSKPPSCYDLLKATSCYVAVLPPHLSRPPLPAASAECRKYLPSHKQTQSARPSRLLSRTMLRRSTAVSIPSVLQ
jgi:hypothetical protein